MNETETLANDPAMQGALPGGISGTYSLAEIEVLSKKAARGAGYSWGLSEEAGKAARVLASYGLPAVEQLAALLHDNDNKPYGQMRPVSADTPWRSESGALCPIITGAAISDRAHLIAAGKTIEAESTAYPLLILFFACLVSHQCGRVISVRWQDLQATCVNEELRVRGKESALTAAVVNSLRVSLGEEESEGLIYTGSPVACPVEVNSWRILENYAFRIYAPATEQSRAGAGSDTDDQN